MIDKLLPMKFVADKDERLVESNEMIAAKNVTVSHRGEGTEMILKTMAGTSNISIEVSDDDNIPVFDADVTVIGKVEQEETGDIFFFCAADSDVNDHVDGIYRYRSSDNEFRPILTGGWFDFNPNGQVQASCIRKAFQQNGILQTIVYFTDNDNPPRKINIERAIAGDYDGLSNDELDIALSVMRKAPTTPPSFTFDTDSNILDNNFVGQQLQYATQIIYKDGEESALSPYSKVANTLSTLFQGVEEGSFGASRFTQNVCKIKHNVDLDTPDMTKIRILVRDGNDGSFYIAEEFDPNESLFRSVGGSYASTEIYSPATGSYKFYNNRFGQLIPDSVTQKNYDNVPLKAEAQTIIDNRLMYSNYKEGFANTDFGADADYTITPDYSSAGNGVSDFIESGDAGLIFDLTDAGNLNIDLDLEDGTQIDDATTFPPGTRIDFSFQFSPEFTATAHNSEDLISVKHSVRRSGYNVPAGSGSTNINATAASLDFTSLFDDDDAKVMEFSFIIPTAMDTDELAEFIQERLDSETFTLRYTIPATEVTSTWQDQDSTFSVNGTARVEWAFGEVSVSANDKIQLVPRIKEIRFTNLYVVSDSWNGGMYQGGSTYVQVESPQNSFAQDGTAQSEVSFSGLTSHAASNPSISISDNGAGLTFKAGATHSFGAVYYDKYGRHGFVKELGEVYVKTLPERTGSGEDKGPVSMSFNLIDSYVYAPSWAESFQIVYGGSSLADSFQYTVGGAYVARKTTTTNSIKDVDTESHVIYVSLKTFDKYQEEREPTKRYSFTEGDKLRILSHRNSSDDGDVYPLVNSKPLEFDVLGVVTGDEAPIQILNAGANDDRDPYKGTFLKLSCPTVEATVDQGSNVTKFVGFDWYQLTGENYNAQATLSDTANYWNREVLVEIFTPKKETSEKIYYEIGHRRKLLTGTVSGVNPGPHGKSFSISSGDVYFRPSMMKHPKYSSGWKDLDGSGIDGTDYTNEENPETWVYSAKYSEDHRVNDYTSKDAWDKGRAHTVFENAAEVTRSNSITYSRAYVDDSSLLPLSQFNLNEANFYDLPSENGPCRFIGKMSDKLLAIQENKSSLLGVGKSVLEAADGSGMVAINTNVINAILPYGADFGTQNPESVVRVDGGYYVVDKKRNGIFYLKGGKLGLISAVDIDSFLEDKISSWESGGGIRIVSGVDPDDSVLFFTFQGGSSEFTVGFNEGLKFWQGEYTFVPDCYASVGNKMFGFKNKSAGDNRYVIHKFGNDSASNVFLGETVAASSFEVVSKSNPSMVKAYKSISLEGDNAWSVTLESSEGQTTSTLSFSEKEDAFYAAISRDSSSKNDTKYLPIGEIDSIDNNNGIYTITFKNSLRGYLIPIGYQLYERGVGSFNELSGVSVLSVNHGGKSITTSGDVSTLAAGDSLFAANAAGVTGDQIRGHYLIVKCSHSPVAGLQRELYAINLNFFESKANHRLGR